MLNIEYEEDGSVSMKADFQEFGMQDPKQLADDRALNFATSMAGDYDVSFAKKAKTIRDPMSHRVIEKRRRDRMNNCLADLSRLIPSDYLKQGQGRIEKTEIIEMAIKHIKNLTNTVNKQGGLKSNLPDRYLGFKECQDEMMRFLVEVEGWDATDRLCIMLMGHLEQAGEKFRIMNDQSLSQVAKEEQYRHADEELNQQMSGPALITEPPCPKIDFPKESPLKAPVPFQPKIIQQEQSSPTTQQATLEGRSAEIPQTYTAYDQALTAQQITQEHLKRDKHLWTLLTSNYNSQVEDSGISVESQMSKSNSNGERDRTDNGTESSYRTGTECSSTFNSKVHESSSEKLDSSVYKFKHNITKRFSQEVRKVHPSDTSSSSSRETNCNEKVKRKMRHVMRCRSPSSSGSSKYPKSSSSTNNSSDCGANTGVPKGEKIPELLPCFVLHTSGTHYVPMSIHPSSVGEEIFNQSHSCIYHPISIPVNFGGPVMYMKKAGTPEVKSESPTISSESADSPSGLGSKENSFGNLWAEASPISQT